MGFSLAAEGRARAAFRWQPAPAGLRRPTMSRYRCSLPGLTGFVASRREDASASRHRLKARLIYPRSGGEGGITRRSAPRPFGAALQAFPRFVALAIG